MQKKEEKKVFVNVIWWDQVLSNFKKKNFLNKSVNKCSAGELALALGGCKISHLFEDAI